MKNRLHDKSKCNGNDCNSKVVNSKRNIMISIVATSITHQAIKESSLKQLKILNNLNNFENKFNFIKILKKEQKNKLFNFLFSIFIKQNYIFINEKISFISLFKNNNLISSFNDLNNKKKEIFLRNLIFHEYFIISNIYLKQYILIEKIKFYKRALDYFIYNNENIKFSHLNYFLNYFNLNKNEFFINLIKRLEIFISDMQQDLKHTTKIEYSLILSRWSCILIIIQFLLENEENIPKNIQIYDTTSIFLIFTSLNKYCKHVLTKINDEQHIISTVSFRFFDNLCQLMLKLVSEKDLIRFFDKTRIIGPAYWYGGIVKFNDILQKSKVSFDLKILVETKVKKMKKKIRFEVSKLDGENFNVSKVKVKEQVKRVYSIFQNDSEDMDENVEVINLFSFQNNNPKLNDSVSTSPML